MIIWQGIIEVLEIVFGFESTHIPVIFNNSPGYDNYFFIDELCGERDQIDVIAQNKQKYVLNVILIVRLIVQEKNKK